MKILNLFPSFLLIEELNLNLSKIKKHCLIIQKKSEGRFRTNPTGFQSNDLKLDDVFKEVVDSMEPSLGSFFDQYKINKTLKLSNFWFNINGYKDYNRTHDHPYSLISGVFYIDVNKDSGDIMFHNPQQPGLYDKGLTSVSERNTFNSKIWRVSPTKNLLLLFPSWLFHSVEPNLSKKNRISMSFNFHT